MIPCIQDWDYKPKSKFLPFILLFFYLCTSSQLALIIKCILRVTYLKYDMVLANLNHWNQLLKQISKGFYKLTFRCLPICVNHLYHVPGQKNRGASMPSDDLSTIYRRAALSSGDLLATADAAVCQLCPHGHVHAA